MTWMLGADPEVFLVDSKKQPVPAHVMFPPKSDPMITPYGKIYRDGWAVELNPHPSHCRELLTRNVQFLLREIVRLARAKGYRVVSWPAVKVDPEWYHDAPEDVLITGCEPSLDAYSGEAKYPTLDVVAHPFRYAGGHMHLGLERYYFDTTGISYIASENVRRRYAWVTKQSEAQLFIRMLDLYVGVPLTYWFHGHGQFLRRQHYGQAGEFRMQRYAHDAVGIEYRTPPPAMWNHPAVASYAYLAMRTVAYKFESFKLAWAKNAKELEPVIQRYINTGKGPVTRLLTLACAQLDDFAYREYGGVTLSTLACMREHVPSTLKLRPSYRSGWAAFVRRGSL